MIFPGASIGAEPQDLKFVGEKSYVYIGDRTKVREYATIHRACGAEEETRIGNDCLLMAYTHVHIMQLLVIMLLWQIMHLLQGMLL